MEEVQSLLSYFSTHRRDLPWRINKDPYRLLLAEIMLQQTRIGAVIPKYEAFLLRFPTILDLANASEEDVLEAWQGLGYYSRAKNLRLAAIQIRDKYHGYFPKTRKEIGELQGIGPYTSASLASFCFGEKAVAVDGNLIRLYARLNAVSKPRDDASIKVETEGYFLPWMDFGDPGKINEALMEVGETICLPKGVPLCEDCPLLKWCKGKEHALEYPLPKNSAPKPIIDYTVYVFSCAGKLGLERRPNKGLLANLYGFPMEEGFVPESDVHANFGERFTDLGGFRFEFTHRIWRMHAYRINEDEMRPDLTYFDTYEGSAIPSAFKEIFFAAK